MQTAFRIPLAVGLTSFCSLTTLGADWQVVVLHPEDAKSSIAYAAAGAQQGGYAAGLGGDPYRKDPLLWNSSSNDYIDLLPPGWPVGQINGMDGAYQVGYVHDGRNPHAALWSGSAESFVDLTPGGDYIFAELRGVEGNQQVGYAGCTCDGNYHAMLWRGSAESYVDLHPDTARSSKAVATDGQRQGGFANFPALGQVHAVMWQGTADSFVDMNPEGSRASDISAVAGDIQVGSGQFDMRDFGVLWKGAPQDFVILCPADGYASRLYATTGTLHAGYVNYSGWAEAGIWIGEDPESFINLHRYLSSDYFASAAYAIAIDHGVVYVAGTGSHAETGQPHAVLWFGRLGQDKGLPLQRADVGGRVIGRPKPPP